MASSTLLQVVRIAEILRIDTVARGRVAHVGNRVRFHSTLELVNALAQQKSAGKLSRITYTLMHVDLVILD